MAATYAQEQICVGHQWYSTNLRDSGWENLRCDKQGIIKNGNGDLQCPIAQKRVEEH